MARANRTRSVATVWQRFFPCDALNRRSFTNPPTCPRRDAVEGLTVTIGNQTGHSLYARSWSCGIQRVFSPEILPGDAGKRIGGLARTAWSFPRATEVIGWTPTTRVRKFPIGIGEISQRLAPGESIQLAILNGSVLRPAMCGSRRATTRGQTVFAQNEVFPPRQVPHSRRRNRSRSR